MTLRSSRPQRFRDQSIQISFTNNFEDWVTNDAIPQPKKVPETPVDEANAVTCVDHKQTILHGGENCLRPDCAFRDLVIELLLEVGYRFQRESDASRCAAAVNKKRPRPLAARDLPNHVFDPAPGRDPSAPNGISERDGQATNRPKQKPLHRWLIFPEAISKSANRLNGTTSFAKLFAQTPHVGIDRSRVDDAFVTPNVIQQSVPRLDAAAAL